MNIFNLNEKDMDPNSPENSSNYQHLNLLQNPGGEKLSMEEDLVLKTLRAILDPELGINIVDLGLIYDLRVIGNEINVKMTMTTPGCPMHGSIVEAAARALELYFPLKKTNIDLIWEPAWTPDRLSMDAKETLGMG